MSEPTKLSPASSDTGCAENVTVRTDLNSSRSVAGILAFVLSCVSVGAAFVMVADYSSTVPKYAEAQGLDYEAAQLAVFLLVVGCVACMITGAASIILACIGLLRHRRGTFTRIALPASGLSILSAAVMLGSQGNVIVFYALSFVMTWLVGLLPSVATRYAIVGRPLSRLASVLFVVVQTVLLLVIWTLVGSRSHKALVPLALISFGILHVGHAGWKRARLAGTEDSVVAPGKSTSEGSGNDANGGEGHLS